MVLETIESPQYLKQLSRKDLQRVVELCWKKQASMAGTMDQILV